MSGVHDYMFTSGIHDTQLLGLVSMMHNIYSISGSMILNAKYPKTTIFVTGIHDTIFMFGTYDTQYLCLVPMMHNIYVWYTQYLWPDHDCDFMNGGSHPIMYPSLMKAEKGNIGRLVTVTSRNLFPRPTMSCPRTWLNSLTNLITIGQKL